MSKRNPSFNISAIADKKKKMEQSVASNQAAQRPKNPYLSSPVQPEMALQIFLTQVPNAARRYLPDELQQQGKKIEKEFCEVEARLGILRVPHSDRRVVSSGAKTVHNKTVLAFDCSRRETSMMSGVSRSMFSKTTEIGPVCKALGVASKDGLVEKEFVETVYTGYNNDARICFPGEHPSSKGGIGKMESKAKLVTMDLTIPAANFDLRVSLSSEKIMDNAVQHPLDGFKSKRIKRRRSFWREDKSIVWQIDATEVTTVTSNSIRTVDYEIEFELLPAVLLNLINENDDAELKKMTMKFAKQLWWILSQINPLKDSVDVEERLQDHPNHRAVQLALAQCGAFKKYMDGVGKYESPIAGGGNTNLASLANVKFVGCMPVNFSRHNIEEIQRSEDSAYYLSEKTDGVRYFMVFTGDTVVLVDRAMRGKQPIPISDKEPFKPILPLIQPGTVFDGEVVMNRGRKRPVFIVFDVLAISLHEPVLQLPFEQRLRHLRQATFRTKNAAKDMFDERFVFDPSVALPLVRKNFVKRTGLDELFSHVAEEQGMRCYRNGELHNHLTDGIIFQPNLPYVLGTDVHLLKWKYLDTVTIDVEMLPLLSSDEDDTLRVGCLGEEQTRVDMTRYILLPKCERARLEADKFENGGRICEVGFDPEIGEWYYLTMRSDKIAPNHISTVLGTLLELAENLTTEELRYRMNVPAGMRDTYRKDLHGMLRQLLAHQRKQLGHRSSAKNHK